jgi:hypothetical protein
VDLDGGPDDQAGDFVFVHGWRFLFNAETQRTQRGKAATELIDVRGHAEHSEDGGSRMEDGGD